VAGGVESGGAVGLSGGGVRGGGVSLGGVEGTETTCGLRGGAARVVITGLCAEGGGT